MVAEVKKSRGSATEIASRPGSFRFSGGNQCRSCGLRHANARSRRRHERRAHSAGGREVPTGRAAHSPGLSLSSPETPSNPQVDIVARVVWSLLGSPERPFVQEAVLRAAIGRALGGLSEQRADFYFVSWAQSARARLVRVRARLAQEFLKKSGRAPMARLTGSAAIGLEPILRLARWPDFQALVARHESIPVLYRPTTKRARALRATAHRRAE